MFDINKYKYDEIHNSLEVEGEAMIFHCHHYLTNLQRTILDADYIDSRPFLIGSAADAVYNQLQNIFREQNTSIEDSFSIAEQMYKAFGYGLIDLSKLTGEGGEIKTRKSFFSKSWLMKFGKNSKPVDYYTAGYLAATYSAIFNVPLSEVNVVQSECMACGSAENVFQIRRGEGNFSIYPPKRKTEYKEVEKVPLNWEYEEVITNAFLGAHALFVGNEEGFIPAFGVYIVRNQSDYVNRLQFEFIRAMTDVAGDYGVTLGGELLLEAGHACGFFTYAGIMTSAEWNQAVKPYLKTKEDWIKGLSALINTLGWGYHTSVELSENKAIFRNYNDFEDLSYLRMYGKSPYPIHWANSGGFTGLMQLVYKTDITETGKVENEEGFRAMRRSKDGYRTRMTKGIACGDDFLEVEVYI
ncbi:MAG: hypothetical protein H7A24_08425 [Leptospiraceae bacterium]|nr:4-vinyl reductase [Leptospiraceae bacterium]MCP5511893.1 hypothetical protein [Leptospiraceae bacterium]